MSKRGTILSITLNIIGFVLYCWEEIKYRVRQ